VYESCANAALQKKPVKRDLHTRPRQRDLQKRPTKDTYKAPDPMNHAQIFKGQPRRFVLWELVPNWYKSLSPDHLGQAEMKDSAMLSNNIGTA